MFPKQAANSLVTEMSQYFVFLQICLFCNSCKTLNYKRFTFNSRHSVFYCISKYYLCCTPFVCDFLIANGVPIETVSKILGHTNIRATQIYARVTDVKVSNDMELLVQKLDIAKWILGDWNLLSSDNSKVCSVLLRIISAALYLFRKSLRSRVSNERKITQINIFFARRDGWSRPLPLGAPRPMIF